MGIALDRSTRDKLPHDQAEPSPCGAEQAEPMRDVRKPIAIIISAKRAALRAVKRLVTN